MPLPFQPRSLDADAAAFIQRSGATDRAAINAFVRGIKALGLYDNMVCWPLRSSQNAGTGTTAYSLGGLGTFNGTLTNGPTWEVDGIEFTAAEDHYISTTLAHWVDEDTFAFCVAEPASTAVVAFSSRLGSGGAELWARNINALSLLTRNSASGTANALVNLAWPASGSYYFAANHGTRSAKAFVEGSLSGANYSSATAATGTGQSQGGNWTIGGSNPFVGVLVGNYEGTIPLCGAVRGNVNQSQNAQFYTLYKQTLGTGLSLP